VTEAVQDESMSLGTNEVREHETGARSRGLAKERDGLPMIRVTTIEQRIET
jgi:hypothetical protein